MSASNLSEATKSELRIELKTLYLELLNINIFEREVMPCYKNFDILMRKADAYRQFFGEGISSHLNTIKNTKNNNKKDEALYELTKLMKGDIEDLYYGLFNERISG